MQKGLGFLNSPVDEHLVCLLINIHWGNSLFLRFGLGFFFFLIGISIVLEYFKEMKEGAHV